MEDLQQNEKKYKKGKRKISFIALVITIIIILLLILLGGLYNKNNEEYRYQNSYVVKGEILSIHEVYPNIFLQIENKEDGVFAVILKDNELISSVLLNNLENIDINDYNVVLAEYNDDGNKDFIYVNSKVESGYKYKFYTIDRKGNISELEISPIELNVQKASVNLIKEGNKYKYIEPIFYYDGYKVAAEVGKHKLSEKIIENKTTISHSSKITVEGTYNPLPRKITKLEEFPKYIQNANPYILEIENKECIEVDLDGDNKNEYIVCLKNENKTDISLFDNASNFLVNLILKDGEKELDELIEIADIDADGIMELIVIDKNDIEIHRYNNGFYY